MNMHPMFQFTIKSNMSVETECTEDNRLEAVLTVTLLPELHCQFQTMVKPSNAQASSS